MGEKSPTYWQNWEFWCKSNGDFFRFSLKDPEGVNNFTPKMSIYGFLSSQKPIPQRKSIDRTGGLGRFLNLKSETTWESSPKIFASSKTPNRCWWFLSAPYIALTLTLPETNSSPPENKPGPKRKSSLSTINLLGVNSLLLVSGLCFSEGFWNKLFDTPKWTAGTPKTGGLCFSMFFLLEAFSGSSRSFLSPLDHDCFALRGALRQGLLLELVGGW